MARRGVETRTQDIFKTTREAPAYLHGFTDGAAEVCDSNDDMVSAERFQIMSLAAAHLLDGGISGKVIEDAIISFALKCRCATRSKMENQ